MRSRKQKAIFMGIGILAGFALSGPAAQAASGITATLSSQPIYVDGQRVSMTAYSIGGNNYVRLRDIGQAVDFGVTYDAATNSVYIDPDAPYQEEVSQPALSSVITEESVRAALAKLKTLYPDGTVYPTPYRSASSGPYSRGDHYSGWAMLCSDSAFGNLPWRRIDNPTWDQIRPGDLVEYKNSNAYHVVVVVSKTDSYISVTESNTNNKALWGGNTSAGGWRDNPIISATPDIRNRQPQRQSGGALNSAAQLVSHVRRFVPILWDQGHPYTSQPSKRGVGPCVRLFQQATDCTSVCKEKECPCCTKSMCLF